MKSMERWRGDDSRIQEPIVNNPKSTAKMRAAETTGT